MASDLPIINTLSDDWEKIDFPPVWIDDVEIFQYAFNRQMNELNYFNGKWTRTNTPMVTAFLLSNNTSETTLTYISDSKYSHEEIKKIDSGDITGYDSKTTATMDSSKNHIVYKASTDKTKKLYDAQDVAMYTY